MPPRGSRRAASVLASTSTSRRARGSRAARRGAREIAARTVQKERARSGESRQASRSSTRDISSGRREGCAPAVAAEGQTQEQLYNEAKRLNVDGRSRMNKRQLQRAVAGKKS